MYWLIGASYFITQPFAALVYVPLFHSLKIVSAYEVGFLVKLSLKLKIENLIFFAIKYLELRFNSVVKTFASIIFCFQMVRTEGIF
jgi:hypothetical protein